MRFQDYKEHFEKKRSELKFPSGTLFEGPGCETKFRPVMPPWMTDWAILYPDGLHIRVKEYYVPQPHPNYAEGQRKHFSFQYGSTTARDHRGMPRTAANHDTIIRIDRDDHGPHLCYQGKNHVQQDEISGSLIINDVELFEFIDGIETFRNSKCSMEDIFFFSMKKAGQR